MPAVQGWTEADLAAREQVFEALVAKSVRMSLRPLTLNLGSIITAAATPSVSATPANPQPVLALAETGVVTATWETYVAAELYPFVTQTFVDSAAATLGGIETALDVSIPKVTESYARDFLAAAFNRLRGIGDLIWSLIRDQLTEGYALGESIHQLAARIRSVAGLTEGRANAVARTEVVSAANLGSLVQVQLGGFSDDECEKEWEATDDERTRPAHAAADGQRVPLSQPFSVGGEGLMVPGDPSGRADNIIQCRCTVLYHFTDDAETDSDDLQPLTAADFDEQKHPRDHDGKFTKKGLGVGKVAASLKPIKINTKVIYNTQYTDQQVVAEKSGTNQIEQRLIWNETTKKFDLQVRSMFAGGDPNWKTHSSFGKGEAYKKFKDENGWFTPGTVKTSTQAIPQQKGPPSLPLFGNMSDDEIFEWFTALTQSQYDGLTSPQKSKVHDVAATQDEVTGSNLNSKVEKLAQGTWPQSSDLKFTGKTVGTHGSKIYRDLNTGSEFLFKPNPGSTFVTDSDVATATLRAKLGLFGPRVEKVTLDGDEGSLQEMLKGDLAFPGKSFKPADLSSDEVLALQREHALDWLIGNHDSHPANFIRTPDGQLVGIDKGQSFKYFSGDKLDWNFHPNAAYGENEPVYNTLYKAYINGDVEIHGTGTTQPFGEFLDQIKSIPDQELRELFRPYAEKAAKQGKLGLYHTNVPGLLKFNEFKSNDVDTFLDKLIKRKNSIAHNFFGLQQRAVEEKEKKQAAKLDLQVKIAHEPVAAPATQVPQKTSATAKPMKINTTVIYKTTYTHGAVVAVKPASATPDSVPWRLAWHESLKKFMLQKQYSAGWVNAAGAEQVAFGKGDAFKKFKDDPGWLTPAPGASALGTSTFGGHAPQISSPTSPGAPTAKDDPDAGTTFDAGSLQQLHGQPPTLTNTQLTQLYQFFKHEYHLGTTTLKSKPTHIFNALVDATEKFNKNSGAPKLNYLQALKLIDEKSTPTGGVNKNLYEKIVVDWLQTSEGKSIAPQSIHNIKLQVTQPSPPKPSTAQMHTSVASKLAELKAPGAIGKPSTTAAQFANLPPTSAAAMHKKMQAASPWNATQVNALKSYTGSSSAVNGMLRSESGTSVNTATMVVDMQSAMRPVPQSFLVHRGTVLGQFGESITSAHQLKNLVGVTVEDKGFVSTSAGGQAAFSASPVMLEIEVPKGTPGAYVKSISLYPSENEFILAAGTKFKILSVATTGHTTVRMRVVP